MRRLLDSAGDQVASELVEADPGVRRCFEASQPEYGCRALRYEVADPTLAESPTLVLEVIRSQVIRGYDPDADAVRSERRERVVGEARSALVAVVAAAIWRLIAQETRE